MSPDAKRQPLAAFRWTGGVFRECGQKCALGQRPRCELYDAIWLVCAASWCVGVIITRVLMFDKMRITRAHPNHVNDFKVQPTHTFEAGICILRIHTKFQFWAAAHGIIKNSNTPPSQGLRPCDRERLRENWIHTAQSSTQLCSA